MINQIRSWGLLVAIVGVGACSSQPTERVDEVGCLGDAGCPDGGGSGSADGPDGDGPQVGTDGIATVVDVAPDVVAPPPTGATIGGTVYGVESAGLVLTLNGGNELPIDKGGAFQFKNSVPYTSTYTVGVLSSPAGQACYVVGATGTANVAAVKVTVSCLGKVQPRFTNAANWMDYVKASATATPCDASKPGHYYTCLHGGEKRSLTLPGVTSCEGWSAADELGAFDWVCDPTSQWVRFRSIGLKEDKGLSDLVDFSTPKWKSNVLILNGPAGEWRTNASIWWSNAFAVIAVVPGAPLKSSGTIYVVKDNLPFGNNGIEVSADNAALLVQPTKVVRTLSCRGSSSSCRATSPGSKGR
jgi:hypothetical protein